MHHLLLCILDRRPEAESALGNLQAALAATPPCLLLQPQRAVVDLHVTLLSALSLV